MQFLRLLINWYYRSTYSIQNSQSEVFIFSMGANISSAGRQGCKPFNNIWTFWLERKTSRIFAIVTLSVCFIPTYTNRLPFFKQHSNVKKRNLTLTRDSLRAPCSGHGMPSQKSKVVMVLVSYQFWILYSGISISSWIGIYADSHIGSD